MSPSVPACNSESSVRCATSSSRIGGGIDASATPQSPVASAAAATSPAELSSSSLFSKKAPRASSEDESESESRRRRRCRSRPRRRHRSPPRRPRRPRRRPRRLRTSTGERGGLRTEDERRKAKIDAAPRPPPKCGFFASTSSSGTLNAAAGARHARATRSSSSASPIKGFTERAAMTTGAALRDASNAGARASNAFSGPARRARRARVAFDLEVSATPARPLFVLRDGSSLNASLTSADKYLDEASTNNDNSTWGRRQPKVLTRRTRSPSSPLINEPVCFVSSTTSRKRMSATWPLRASPRAPRGSASTF